MTGNTGTIEEPNLPSNQYSFLFYIWILKNNKKEWQTRNVPGPMNKTKRFSTMLTKMVLQYNVKPKLDMLTNQLSKP